MENVLFTPVTLWEGFDYNLPLDTTVLKEYIEDGVHFREVYCSGREIGDSRVRIYGLFAFNEGESGLPCMLLVGDCDKGPDIELMKYVCGRGYCVFMPDYSGEKSDCPRFTVYPQVVDYANYQRCGRHLEYADTTARETCWYEWTATARYALTQALAMPECNGSAAVLGFKRGGLIAWQMAAADERLKAAGALFFAGWERYRGVYKYGKETNLEMADEMRKYLAGIAVESYASFLRVPFLYLSATNDTCTDMDRAFDTLARVPQEVDLLYAFSPRLYELLGERNFRNLELFFAKYLKGLSAELPPRPQLTVEREGEDLSFLVRGASGARELHVYLCENMIVPATRNWVEIPVSFQDDGTWRGVFRPAAMEGRIFAYALAGYASGFTTSGNFFTRELGEQTAPPVRSNVLYMGSMGEDSFTCYMTDEERSLTRAILSVPRVYTVKGPMGITGVSNSVGGLATYKFSDYRYRGGEDNLLRFDIYSKVTQRLRVTFFEHKGMPSERRFEAEYNLLGGEIWQPIECRPSDFKTVDGYVMKDWTHITMGVFEGLQENIVLNNLIWV